MLNRVRFLEELGRRASAIGWQRSIDGSACLYRGPNGLRCAIGLMLPEGFRPENQDRVEEIVYLHGPELALGWAAYLDGPGGIDDDDSDFLGKVQQCHDNAFGPEDYEEAVLDMLRIEIERSDADQDAALSERP